MAFERGGKKLWTQAKTSVNTTLYPDAPSPGYRDLELDGKTIWAACACDAVGGQSHGHARPLRQPRRLLARSSRPSVLGDVGG
jgi:hypothetical protein